MPVIIPRELPATEALAKEYIAVMHEERALQQDIRPLRIAIVNLMPLKIVTETQILRLIGNTPLQIDVDLIMPSSHVSTNTSEKHLFKFYKGFDEVRKDRYDGMIITGAPVEMMNFEEVDYWQELTEILDFANTNVYSSIFICWASQAALYYYYGVPKVMLPQKLFGVYDHKIIRNRDITRGFDDVFYCPQSRHTENRAQDIARVADLKVLAQSDDAGVLLAVSIDQRQYFISGHLEYDPLSLKDEYDRDMAKGMTNVPFPYHYFPGDDPSLDPVVLWRSHANLLASNWLNHVVYPGTPYDLQELTPRQPVQ